MASFWPALCLPAHPAGWCTLLRGDKQLLAGHDPAGAEVVKLGQYPRPRHGGPARGRGPAMAQSDCPAWTVTETVGVRERSAAESAAFAGEVRNPARESRSAARTQRDANEHNLSRLVSRNGGNDSVAGRPDQAGRLGAEAHRSAGAESACPDSSPDVRCWTETNCGRESCEADIADMRLALLDHTVLPGVLRVAAPSGRAVTGCGYSNRQAGSRIDIGTLLPHF